MKAIVFDHNLPRYGAARVASMLKPGVGSRVGPLRLSAIDEPELPGEGWHRVRPLLSGICGSDLSTIDGHSSRYFEPIVSFPFVLGHEVVGVTDDGRRVSLKAVLSCFARGIDPPCEWCAAGQIGNCTRITVGHVAPGLQTGFCADTGGGWGESMIAHQSQLQEIPDDFSDEAAVVMEPTACGVHAAFRAHVESGASVIVLGAGTLGLCAIAALRKFTQPKTIVATAKYPHQQRLAKELGAEVVVEPREIRRAVRRLGDSPMIGSMVADGADVVVDAVGTPNSIKDALDIIRPRGRVVTLGMPGELSLDLTVLWHREIELTSAYAYGVEPPGKHSFELAIDVIRDARLERLVSAHYPLDDHHRAIEHAATAGRRGATRVVFDLRKGNNR